MPSPDTACATLTFPPGRKPRPTIPPAEVHRKASMDGAGAVSLKPTTTELSRDTLVAWLVAPPGRKPRPIIPLVAVQRKAWSKSEPKKLKPTTTEPSADA